MKVRLVSFSLSIIAMSLFFSTAWSSEVVTGRNAFNKIQDLLAVGVHTGKNKAHKTCTVELNRVEDNFFVALVNDPDAESEDLGINTGFDWKCVVKEYKKGLLVQYSEDDGDEANGGYTITDSFKISKRGKNQLVVTGSKRYVGGISSYDKGVCTLSTNH